MTPGALLTQLVHRCPLVEDMVQQANQRTRGESGIPVLLGHDPCLGGFLLRGGSGEHEGITHAYSRIENRYLRIVRLLVHCVDILVRDEWHNYSSNIKADSFHAHEVFVILLRKPHMSLASGVCGNALPH